MPGAPRALAVIVPAILWSLGLLAFGQAPAKSEKAAPAPLTLAHTEELPGFTGDFDHFAVDEKGGRLFLAGEDHKTVEVFDSGTGRRLKSIAGFGTPHTIFYLSATDRILVTDGEKGMLQILRGSDYAVVQQVDGLAGADSARLDAGAQILYVVTGGKDVPLDYSFLVAIDLKTSKKIGELRFQFMVFRRRSTCSSVGNYSISPTMQISTHHRPETARSSRRPEV